MQPTSSPAEGLLCIYEERAFKAEIELAEKEDRDLKPSRFITADAVAQLNHDEKWIGQAVLAGIHKIYKEGDWTQDGFDTFNLWCQQFIVADLTDDYINDILRIHERVILRFKQHRIIDNKTQRPIQPETIINEIGIGSLKAYSQLMASTDDTAKHVEYLNFIGGNRQAKQADAKTYARTQMGKNTITLPWKVTNRSNGKYDVAFENIDQRQFELLRSLVARYILEEQYAQV